MELNRGLLKDATENGLINEQQAEQLWKFLSERGKDTPSFRFTHVLYYLGGLIAIGAMSLFMTLGWERFGGWGLFFIALAYASAGLWLTEFFLYRSRLPIPAGITATFVVVLTPLAVYGLQAALGWWAEGKVFREYHTLIDWRWMFMEFATLASGAVMLWRYRLPFLVMPIAVTLWYMSALVHEHGFDPLSFRRRRLDVGVTKIRIAVVWPAHRNASFLGGHSNPA